MYEVHTHIQIYYIIIFSLLQVISNGSIMDSVIFLKIDSKVFRLNEKNGVVYLTYDALSAIPFIRHAFSTKIGEGTRTVHPMDMSFDHDNRAYVTENYQRFCQAAGFDYPSLIASSQDHHTFVRVCTSADKGVGIYREKDIESVDALVTIEPGLTLCTYYADCTPLFFVDAGTHAIGLAHGGWRGTVDRIAAKVVAAMEKSFGTDPADLICAIGPNIGKCCYEVDEPCAARFYELDLDSERFVFPKGGGKYMVDMRECNRQILVSCGVKPENITIGDLCTKCSSDLLWSHRATHGDRGTMCAMLRINPER